jgi:hypothetical protein
MHRDGLNSIQKGENMNTLITSSILLGISPNRGILESAIDLDAIHAALG